MRSRIKSLFTSPRADVFIGLIDENGVVRSSFKEECSISFTLCAYKKNNEALIEEEVYVTKKIPNFEYSIQGLEPLTIVELTGEQIVHHGQNRINLNAVIGTNSVHPELSSLLERRLEPVTYVSETFGLFYLNRRLGWFELKTSWKDREVELFLSGEVGRSADLDTTARTLFQHQHDWDPKFRRRISDNLLGLKNDSWLEETESPMTRDELEQRVSLNSIVVFDGEIFEAWFDDGDVFGGHGIRVVGNLNGDLDTAELHG
ncbi:MAG: DUF2262 domain-containing protein [Flavobacteriales bacterium]